MVILVVGLYGGGGRLVSGSTVEVDGMINRIGVEGAATLIRKSLKNLLLDDFIPIF